MNRYVGTLAVIVGIWAGAGQAQQPTSGLTTRIAALESGSDQGFELGAMRTLRAVETVLQTRYRHAIGAGLDGFPIMRLPIPASPANPQPVTPETFSTMIADLLAGLNSARAAMQASEAEAFDLTLQDIWFDVNENGARDTDEGALEMLAPLLIGPDALQDASLSDPLVVRFDAADQAWLMAYTHLLSGLGEAVLAFDPAPVLTDLAQAQAQLAAAPVKPAYYTLAQVERDIRRLEQDLAEAEAQVNARNTQGNDLRQQKQDLLSARQAATDADRPAFDARIAEVNQHLDDLDNGPSPWRVRAAISNELASAKAKLPDGQGWKREVQAYQPTIDAVYVLISTLNQQPDVDHIRAVRAHWLAMVAENQRFWTLLAAEQDDDREWIPNEGQSPVLPITIPPRTAQAWQAILTDMDAVLNGHLLVNHPLLPPGYGIDLAKWFDDPSPLDLAGWIHGKSAYPYAARGPTLTAQSWAAFSRLATGNAVGFALFFN